MRSEDTENSATTVQDKLNFLSLGIRIRLHEMCGGRPSISGPEVDRLGGVIAMVTLAMMSIDLGHYQNAIDNLISVLPKKQNRLMHAFRILISPSPTAASTMVEPIIIRELLLEIIDTLEKRKVS